MSKTMTRTSDQKTKANRQNAAKSTGPRTAAGKDRSRLNALKHGLRAEQVVVLGGPNPEEPRDFEDLRDGLIDDRKPIGALEELLVERLAVGFWRLRRAYRFEAETIAQANRISPVSKMLDELSALPPREPVEHVLPTVQNLDKLVRYESMIDRELLRSMMLLQRVQHRRKRDEEPSDPFDAAPARNPDAQAGASTDRRSEEGEGSRKCGLRPDVKSGSTLRCEISDCGLRNRESTPGLGPRASGRSLKPEARSLKPSSLPRFTIHASRTPNDGPREDTSGRTNPSAPMPHAANRLQPAGAMRTPQDARHLQEAAGFGPRESTKEANPAQCDRPRGLRAHGSGGKRTRGFA